MEAANAQHPSEGNMSRCETRYLVCWVAGLQAVQRSFASRISDTRQYLRAAFADHVHQSPKILRTRLLLTIWHKVRSDTGWPYHMLDATGFLTCHAEVGRSVVCAVPAHGGSAAAALQQGMH